MSVRCPKILVVSSVIAFTLLLSACGGGEGGGSTPAAENQAREQMSGRLAVAAATQVISSGDPDCPEGGILVETGIDENGNGVLDPDEVDDTHKVCNGATGERGVPGQQGPRGADGLTARVNLSRVTKAPGCPAGGLRIDSGLDANRNGALEPGETGMTRYVCDGVVGESLGEAWEGPVALELNFDAGDTQPAMAMNRAGNAIVAWASYSSLDGANYAVYFDVQAGQWSVPFLLREGESSTYDYTVAIGGDGKAWVAWSDGGEVKVRRYDPLTQSWGDERSLGAGRQPSIAANETGEVQVAWLRDEGSTVRLLSMRYTPADGSWSTETEVANAATLYPWSTIALAMDGTGNAVVVWEQEADPRLDIWAAYYDAAASSWGAPVLLEGDTTESAEAPQVAMDDSGNAIVVWEQGPLVSQEVGVDGDGNPVMVWVQSESHIWAASYDAASATWDSPLRLEDHTSATEAMQPSIAMNGGGEAVVAWTQGNHGFIGETEGEAWAVTYHAHTGWTAPRRLDQGMRGDSWGTMAAINEAGDAIVVWNQFDGMRVRIWSATWRAGLGWQGAERVERENVAYVSGVGLDDAGRAMVVWEWREGESRHIVASRREAP